VKLHASTESEGVREKKGGLVGTVLVRRKRAFHEKTRCGEGVAVYGREKLFAFENSNIAGGVQ